MLFDLKKEIAQCAFLGIKLPFYFYQCLSIEWYNATGKKSSPMIVDNTGYNISQR